MSRRRLLSRDPLMGTETYFHYHDENDSMTIETITDVSDIVAGNKRDFNDASSNWSGDWHRVASLPLNVLLQLQEQGIAQDEQAFRRWLNDPDHRAYRTKPGKV